MWEEELFLKQKKKIEITERKREWSNITGGAGHCFISFFLALSFLFALSILWRNLLGSLSFHFYTLWSKLKSQLSSTIHLHNFWVVAFFQVQLDGCEFFHFSLSSFTFPCFVSLLLVLTKFEEKGSESQFQSLAFCC